jgi:hypothetical protein
MNKKLTNVQFDCIRWRGFLGLIDFMDKFILVDKTNIQQGLRK